ncbi:hypothetical protein K501DRAFT_288004 [Backusella circina FSU 941]|nr:hypothetical protein K501DRAFT_288004 [Backusella circina FSU 941]
MLLFDIIERLGKRHYERLPTQQDFLPDEIIEILKSLQKTCTDELEQQLRLFLLESTLSLVTNKRILQTMHNPCVSNLNNLCLHLDREKTEDIYYCRSVSHILLAILKIAQKYQISVNEMSEKQYSVINEKEPLLEVNKDYSNNQEKIQHQIKEIDCWMLMNTPSTIQTLWQEINRWAELLNDPPCHEEPPSYHDLYQLFSILDHTHQAMPRLNNQRAEEVPDILEKKIRRSSRNRMDNQRASLPITKLEMQLLKCMSRSLDNQRVSFVN